MSEGGDTELPSSFNLSPEFAALEVNRATVILIFLYFSLFITNDESTRVVSELHA